MQTTLISYLQHITYGGERVSEIIYHIPNGGKRNAIEAARFKKMGVRAGVGDLFLMVPVRSFHGAYWELKAGKNKPTETQINFRKQCVRFGYYYEVHYSWLDCLNDIIGYLRGGDLPVMVNVRLPRMVAA